MNIDRVLIVIKGIPAGKFSCGRNLRIYGRKITDETSVLMAVEEFFEEKDIPVDYTVVENIADAITKGKHFWYDERYCFQIADIYC